MSTTIDYKQTDLRTISAVEQINIYNACTGAYETKEVTRFTDSAYGTGTAQDIKLHAYQYTANGEVQTVSMSQLFMTICMNRANDLEAETVEIMDEMSQNTTKINELADIEDIYLNGTKTSNYSVWCSMNFSITTDTLPAYSIAYLAEEVDLEVPSYIPTLAEEYKTISAEDFEKYKSFISEIIEENRERLLGGELDMGTYFHMAVFLHQSHLKHHGTSLTLVEAFEDLFGQDKEEFTTCKWYTTSPTLNSYVTAYNYQVGDKYFQTLEEVYAYAKSEYGIDMSQDQSTVTSAIESKLDEYNSISQEQMIELQSLVSKRDQAYTLISNALKSMYNSNLSAANNF